MSQLILPILQRPRRRRGLSFRGEGQPAARGTPERASQPAGQVPSGGAPGARPGFVLLIVDDDPLMTDMLPRRMRKVLRADVEICTAANADEAVELIRTLRPDVVLSDYNLRQLKTGLDVLREAQSVAPNAVRILFSGHAADEIPGLADAPIHAYVEKPMKLDELIPPVLEAIERATGEDLRGGRASGA